MAAIDVRLATGPVSWGVDFADSPKNPSWQLVLDEIAASPLDALELGPVGYLPEDPEDVHDALASRGLTAVGSFVFEDFHNSAQRDYVLATTLRACRAIKSAGGGILVIIDRPCPARSATAGRSGDAARLVGDDWRQMTALVADAAGIAREHGLRAAFHPHAGSYVEFADEIDHLLDDTSVDLCLDTGHAAYAGDDPADAVRVYASRLAHLHLKDIRRSTHAQVVRESLDFWQAVDLGVFCPLGQGIVDTDRIAEALDNIGYTGFATIEQDRTPGHGTPLEDLETSVEVLAQAGIGTATDTVAAHGGTEESETAR